MAQRLPSALMALWFVLFAIISARFFLEDITATAATSERTHTGSPAFIVLDILCIAVCLAGVALFTSLFWACEPNRPERSIAWSSAA